MNLLEAFQIASTLHRGQVDKAGRPYIEHLVRVQLRVQAAGGDLYEQIAALLHDCIEDEKATESELVELGVPSQSIRLVVLLAKPKNGAYLPYLLKVRKDLSARRIKSCDVDDNNDPERLDLLPVGEARRLRKKYSEAIEFLSAAF
jgi:hypothetical protein